MRDGVKERKAVDLHVHSNKSDGTFTPSELVDYAIEKGLAAMALTDHDTVAGLGEIREYAAKVPGAPEIINGIELSTDLDGRDIHIVGLFIDDENPRFLGELQKFRDSRELRNEKMCAGLKEGLGMDISLKQLREEFPGSVLTRGHYAKYMLHHGYVRTMREAFEKWIGDDGPYFVPREKITPVDGIKLINMAGGVPVLAHPIQYAYSHNKLENLLVEWKEAGLVAMETVYTTYSAEDMAEYKAMAEKLGLLESGGSDFHGTNKVNTDLATGRGNLFVPYEFLEKLRVYSDNMKKGA
ncbi:MAG: PHP domain-containing protein [Lachnospiraceae bacterium]|nr:PHP domain-containing protein [Lachnospiraceae bacterium]